TQFFKAANSGDTNTVALELAQNNIDINAIDPRLTLRWSGTALMYACHSGRDSAVKLLLARNNIQINLQDREKGSTALIHACSKQHITIVNKSGWTALMYACRYNLVGVVESFLRKDDIQVNMQDK
ncbi:ankyrin repeat-containing domain protein, partial [Pyronema domesticum]